MDDIRDGAVDSDDGFRADVFDGGFLDGSVLVQTDLNHAPVGSFLSVPSLTASRAGRSRCEQRGGFVGVAGEFLESQDPASCCAGFSSRSKSDCPYVNTLKSFGPFQFSDSPSYHLTFSFLRLSMTARIQSTTSCNTLEYTSLRASHRSPRGGVRSHCPDVLPYRVIDFRYRVGAVQHVVVRSLLSVPCPVQPLPLCGVGKQSGGRAVLHVVDRVYNIPLVKHFDPERLLLVQVPDPTPLARLHLVR